METNYNQYSDQQLVELWGQKWKGTESSFCRTFVINQGNFHGFCKGNRVSKQSRDAIIKLLNEQENTDQSVIWKTVNDLISFVPSPNITKIIWIDGDNSAYTLKNLTDFLHENVYVFFFYVKDRYSRYTYGLGEYKNITFIHSISHIKDSVDVAITLLSTQVNSVISKYIEYIFISRDHFVKDLHVYFSNFRPCKVIMLEEDLLMLSDK